MSFFLSRFRPRLHSALLRWTGGELLKWKERRVCACTCILVYLEYFRAGNRLRFWYRLSEGGNRLIID